MTRDPAELVREFRSGDWDDIRRRRVFRRIQDERFRRPAASWWQWMIGGGLMTAAAAALLFVWSTRPAGEQLEMAQVDTAVTAAPSATGPGTPGAIWLSEGIAAHVFADAELSLLARSAERMVIGQTRGTVRYEVEPGQTSAFEVKMQGVSVRVLGTIFDVSGRAGAVHVGVERGKVQVTHRGGVSVLTAGQSGDFLGLEEAVPDDLVEPGEESPPAEKAARASKDAPPLAAAELLRLADEARRHNRDREAATHLRALLRHYPDDPRAAAARFTLGRIETARKRFLVAARQFQLVRKVAADSPLAEDALAEEAWTRHEGGEAERARDLAQRYLERYPRGPNRARMQGLVSSAE